MNVRSTPTVGGRMAALITGHDWASTPIGARGSWPEALRTALGLMLDSGFPMFLLWGPERTQLYNDAYVPFLGARHPAALGQPFEQNFPEAWAELEPLVARTTAGETCFFEDLPLTLRRHGADEATWWTFSYSPLRDKTGAVQGMLCVCNENTARVQTEAALRESQTRQRRLLGSITDGYLGLTAEWRITDVNHAAEAILGPVTGLLDRSLWEAFPGLDLDGWRQFYEGVMASRVPAVRRAFYPDHGRTYEVRLLPAEGGGLSIFFRNVTEEEAKAEALRNSERRLELALEGTSDGIWDWNITTGEVFHSPRFIQMLGHTPAEWEATYAGWMKHLHPEDMTQAEAVLQGYLAGSLDEYANVFRMRHKDGGWRWILSRAKAMRDGDGRPLRMVGAHTDITAQKQAEAAMRESEARFRAVADTAPIIIWTADADGTLNWYNEQWYLLTGAPRGLGGDASWTPVIHPEDLANVVPHWLDCVQRGVPYEAEVRFKDPATGDYRWQLSRAAPVKDTAGTVLSWVGSNADIHDQKRAAEILARSREELERLVEERTVGLRREAEERRRAEAQLRHAEKLTAMGQMTGGIAHDFGNVLQVVDSGMNLLRSPNLTPEDRETVIEGVLQSASSARALVRALMAFARQQPLEPARLDVNARLSGLTELLRHALGSRVQLEVAFGEDLPETMIDPSQLDTAVLNLAMNARDAMPQGGTLTLSTVLQEGRVALTIADTGQGMEPAQLARIFEPFFTTKPPGEGTGLGLAQVHGFITQSGGEITAESTPGAGSCFRLLLPAG